MSDTVLTSLITFAAGAVGALTAYLAARYSAKAETRRRFIELQYNARLSAFAKVISAHSVYLINPNIVEGTAQFLDAISEACILASEDTRVMLLAFQEAVITKRPDCREYLLEVLKEMSGDLSKFADMKIVKQKSTIAQERKSKAK